MSTTAKFIDADEFAKDIRQFADKIRSAHNEQMEALQAEYWRLHNQLSEQRFRTRWDQITAIKELSELGLALHGMAQAYRAVSTAACITG